MAAEFRGETEQSREVVSAAGPVPATTTMTTDLFVRHWSAESGLTGRIFGSLAEHHREA